MPHEDCSCYFLVEFNMMKLAILMTCYNRRAKTSACLKALYQQKLPPEIEMSVFLVDDGSTDGTGKEVQTEYPDVHVLQGTGRLYWNGGMRLAFSEAVKYDYDYYLWLNDDTLLYPHAIATLINISHTLAEQGTQQAIVVGSTQDEESGAFSYGGKARTSWWHPLKFQEVEPSEEIKSCLTMNGNCVLNSRHVVQAIGNLDPAFTHSIGDVDYGLRFQQHGGSVWIAPGYVGSCTYNPLRHAAWDEPNLTLRERWNKINQPRGLPIQEWKVFSQRHAGFFWLLYWLLPYVRLVVSSR